MRYLILILLLTGCAGSSSDEKGNTGCTEILSGDTFAVADCYRFTLGPAERYYVQFTTEGAFTIADDEGDLFSYSGGESAEPLFADMTSGVYTLTLHDSMVTTVDWTEIP